MSDEANAGGGSKNDKLVLIISALNTVASIGVIVVLILSFQKEKAKVTVDDVVAGRAKEGDAHGGAHGGGHGEKPAEGHGDAHGGGHGGGGHGGGHGGKEEGSDAEKVIPLDLFTINLASTVGTGPRYVRINMSLELEHGNTDEEIKAKLARVRDTIINILNSKKASDVASLEGRDVLKDEMKRSLNSFLTQVKIKNIYFTNFQISN